MVGRVAVEELDLSALERHLARPIQKDEVHHPGDSITPINGRSAIAQDFAAGKRSNGNRIYIPETEGAPAVDKGEGIPRAECTQIDKGLAVAAVGIVLR